MRLDSKAKARAIVISTKRSETRSQQKIKVKNGPLVITFRRLPILLGLIGRWSGRGTDASQTERLGRSCLYIASFALSLARSAQAERDNESRFFVRTPGVHQFKRRYHVNKENLEQNISSVGTLEQCHCAGDIYRALHTSASIKVRVRRIPLALIVLFACLVAAAQAGYLNAPAVEAYAAPALASYAAPALASYAAPALASYGAPVVAKAYAAPAVSSVSSYTTHTAHAAPLAYAAPVVKAAPVVAKAIAPAISSVSSYSSHTSHGAPLVAKTYAAPVAYSAPVAYTAHAAPVATYAAHGAPVATYAAHAAPIATYAAHATPVATYAAHAAPVAAYAAHGSPVATYAAAPVLKSAVTYSAAPAVSHVAYAGLGAHYGW
ncbi:Cuticle protein LPCP-23 [Eumeta japonica]|uniref:Cuticle protein LPCP-23 n=1 Tax=Eumeta variegata TaxID=151549 RepID=A0A4C1WPT3_EUMVA|nr:Cuticle protein LPCP-23 [Eumeta japonica]